MTIYRADTIDKWFLASKKYYEKIAELKPLIEEATQAKKEADSARSIAGSRLGELEESRGEEPCSHNFRTLLAEAMGKRLGMKASLFDEGREEFECVFRFRRSEKILFLRWNRGDWRHEGPPVIEARKAGSLQWVQVSLEDEATILADLLVRALWGPFVLFEAK